MKNQHDEMTDKPTLAHSKTAPIRHADQQAQESEPSPPFSTTARAEELPPTRHPPTSADRKSGDTKLATLQHEYDGLLEQIRDARTDPLKVGQLIRRKGAVVREMDAIKRQHGL